MKKFTNKELKRAGIYSITNTVTGQVYYGNTKNLYTRLNAHISTYNIGIHGNPKMRAANEGGCDWLFKVLHFEEDSTVRKDLEKAYQLKAKDKSINRDLALVNFTLKATTINSKMKYISVNVVDHEPIPLCYKTK